MRDVTARHHAVGTVPRGWVILGAAVASWLLVGAVGVTVWRVFTWLVSTL
jgi:hypothetical protein